MDSSFFLEYMPHGYCYEWLPSILWLSVLSDLGISCAYFSISIALFILIRKRAGKHFNGIFALLASFIFLCGVTHLASIYTVWFGAYGTHTLLKSLTAIGAVAFAFMLFRNIDRILSIPSVSDYKAAVNSAASERILRGRLEAERRSDEIIKYTSQLVPTGLLVTDESQKVRFCNRVSEEMFGYSSGEITGMTLGDLIEVPIRERHATLANKFMEAERGAQLMASGRTVKGVSKQGEPVYFEINLAVHEINGERLAFANIMNVAKISKKKQDTDLHQERVVRAIEATNEGVWEWNVQNNEVWYSRKLMSLIGCSEDKVGKFEDWEFHIHKDDRSHVFDSVKNHFSSKKPYSVIYRGDIGGGIYEWMHSRGDTVFDKEGKPLLMTGTLSNINEVQLLRENLLEKTQFLNHILEKSLTGVYIFNIQTSRNTYINPEYTRLTGWTEQDLDRLQDDSGSLLCLFHPDERGAIIDHIDKVVSEKNEIGIGIEFRFKHKDGRWVWCYSRDTVLNFDKDGMPKDMLGTFFDISDIKQSEKIASEFAMNFTATFDQAAVGMAMLTLDGEFSQVNDKLCEIFGYNERELLGRTFQFITYPDDLEKCLQQVNDLLVGRCRQFILRKRYIKKDGSIIWAQVTGTLVFNDKNEKSHLSSVIEDISERVAIENALAASNASLERFAYSASHDLQEPLRKISAFSGMLMERLQGRLTDRDAIFQLDRISDSAKRMSEMIQSLLELSRFSREELVKRPVKLSDALHQVTEDLGPRILSSNAQIDLQDDAILYVERNSFQQVLQNLILNSIQYAKPEVVSHITITLKRHEGKIEIHFVDNGMGFSEGYSEQIFEPFRRLVPREKQGTGMGLAICRQIVSSHKGDIYARSLSSGAEFVIILPTED